MALEVLVGHDTRRLASELAARLGKNPPGPFGREVVVVQSPAVERYLRLEMASRLGICAGIDFPYPVRFAYSLFGLIAPLAREPKFGREAMTLAVHRALSPDFLTLPECGPLDAYLAGDSELKRVQLASRIASHFDSCLIYRPQIILAWDRGEGPCTDNPHEPWLAGLWRKVAAGHQEEHRASLLARFRETLAKGPPEGLPERVFIFGVPYLPPFYLDLLESLAAHAQVIVLHWAPGLDRQRGQGAQESQNRLLATSGLMGRDYLHDLASRGADVRLPEPPPAHGNMLARLKADLLADRRPGERVTADPDDDSIRIHSCHGPRREAEVLHDSLLGFLDSDPDLAPDDIAVMCPDIATYAPYLGAVFGSPPAPGLRIPYSLESGSGSQAPLARTLDSLLRLELIRFEASEVLSLLETPAVAARFGMEAADIETVRGWVDAARIRWGRDEHEKAAHGLPPFRENTWAFGLDRLLLGFARPGNDDLYAEIAPLDLVEGGEALVLGRLCEFLRQLDLTARQLGEMRSLEGWSRLLQDILERFLAAASGSDEEEGLVHLGRVAAGLGQAGALGRDGDEKVGVRTIRQLLADRLDEHGSPAGRGQGVRMGSPASLRGLPFKVVCLVGMNDGAFPPEDNFPGFDLMAADPRPGDRSPRMEGRHMFLEAVAQAGDRLYISYTGQSQKDNSELPPSVLVSELVDCLEEGFAAPEDRPLRDMIIVRHRLQPFNPDYFRPDSPLTSYSGDDCLGAIGLATPAPAPGFFTRDLPPLGPGEWEELDIATLSSFLGNPCAFLLKNRLGLYLRMPEDLVQDLEPLSRVGGLERYLLGERMLSLLQEGRDAKDIGRLFTAQGELPHGKAGRIRFRELSREVASMVKALKGITLNMRRLDPVTATVEVNGRKITARLEHAWDQAMIHNRFANLKPKDLLRAWVEHLFANLLAARGHKVPTWSRVMGRDGQECMCPVEDAEAILSELLELFESGMRRPLPLFPHTSGRFVAQCYKGMEPFAAAAGCRDCWFGNEYRPVSNDCDDPYIALCFPDDPRFDKEFQELASKVYGPIHEHLNAKGAPWTVAD